MVYQQSSWLIGDGKSVLFWSEKWLDSSLVDKLNVSSCCHLLKTRVAAFISNQQWALPMRSSTLFPDVAKQIIETPLPSAPECDLLIWENSTSGLFSFSEGYDLFRRRFGVQADWATTIWKGFIPPHFSMLAWRLFHLKLPTVDQLQRRGIPIVSVCQLCPFGHVEDLPHLFVNCSFAQHVWQWLACYYGTYLPSHGPLLDFWDSFMSKAFSPQLKNLWLASGLFALMAIWKSRNKLRFENK
ncbi:putative reverse transcriptase zinc-binding domain-containing protein [Rosa chinensis]|uniref:Putative reverse transcriptase zinc-binding domain-containing protein n=1 Tax=Rosa chinensis TaxID=74649 RepID=A0A2P6Q6T5_ROSCH|nr:putative reverse transcriptase zinc-binding domain-containing protein [Rosa chinensis]